MRILISLLQSMMSSLLEVFLMGLQDDFDLAK